MVKKIFSILNREFSGINEAALLLGGFAFLSQLLGLIRDRALANMIGPGPVLDIYYAAFRIPDFLYVSLASLASITVLMPFIVDKINKEGKEKAREFLNNIFTVFMAFMVGISIIMVFIMPYLVKYIAPGFSESQTHLLIMTSRIMLLSPIFIGFSNLIGTITQLYKNFLVFSLSPIFYNVGIILGILFLYPIFGVLGLAFGVIFGAIMHFLIQVPVVIKHQFFPKFISNINWKEIYKVMRISLPRTITLSCNSLAFIFLISIASRINPGSISLFTFSFNLQSVPVGIIGTSFSVAAFPLLVQHFSLKNMDKFMSNILSTARQIIFWSFPVMSLLIVLRAQIVRVILGTGTFSWADTRITSAAVALFAISLFSQGLVLLFVRGYYASGNTKKPLIINVSSSILVILFAYLFLFIFKNSSSFLLFIENLLRIDGVNGSLMMALPLSYTLGSLINVIVLWFSFKKDFKEYSDLNISNSLIQSFTGSVIMGSVAYIMLGILSNILDTTTGLGIFLQGFISGIIGIIAGLFILFLFKNKELLDITYTLKHKFTGKRIIVPEQKEL